MSPLLLTNKCNSLVFHEFLRVETIRGISRCSHDVFAPVTNHLTHLLNSFCEILHWWAVRESHKVDALALLEVTDFTRIDVKKHSWDTDDIVLNTLLKETETGEYRK